MNSLKLIPLKDELFEYCNKTYTQKRWVSSDLKLLITFDTGFDYCLVWRANAESKATMVEDDGFYYKNNRHSYPIYSVLEMLQRIEKFNITSEHTLKINPTQYKSYRK